MIRLVLFGLLQLTTESPAVLQGSAGTVRGDGWEISGLETVFELSDSGLRGDFRIARLLLVDSGRAFDDIIVSCVSIAVTTRTVACDEATFTAPIPGLERQEMRGRFSYDRRSGAARVELSQFALAGSQLRVTALVDEAGIDIRFNGRKLQLDGLLEVARRIYPALADASVAGLSDVSGRLFSGASGRTRIEVGADLFAASLANEPGTVAADGVYGRIDIEFMVDDDGAEIAITFDSERGEAYVEPAYANFSEHAMRLQAAQIRTQDFATFDVGHFRLQQASTLDMAGSAALAFPDAPSEPLLFSAAVELHDCSVAGLYTNLVQVRFAGTLFGNLDTDGRVTGLVEISDNALAVARLQLDGLVLDDQRGRFAVYGLGGNLDWRADPSASPGPSLLRWDSGTAYNIILGGGEAGLQLGDDDIELLAPLRLPTMGGALLIDQLVLRDFGSDDASGVLDAELEPVQLGQLSGAFGWPAFSGTLSGRLPLLQLAGDTVTVGGTLSARAFDGTVEMSKLQIEQPFGRVPRLRAEVQFRDLSLERITEAFSFGTIQGRLSGDVTGLKMRNWRPVEMDMHFYTPVDDKSQHRISQRAVENIANIGGGGAAAVLSSGLMRYFDVFAYDRIGLRCVLRNEVCAMSGAGPSPAGAQGVGYYIVKGRGLPRIDVVGYRNEVSWPRLVRQLAAITRSGAPTVNGAR